MWYCTSKNDTYNILIKEKRGYELYPKILVYDSLVDFYHTSIMKHFRCDKFR